jgi:hypothetical protein
MGQYSITAGTFGKALAVTPVAIGALDSRSAWEFENQSGNLGNNYTGSQIYVGGTGNVDVILAGVVGAQDTVTGLNLAPIFPANPSYPGFSGGTGYTTGIGLATSATSLVHKSPANQPAGLAVDITANVMATVGAAGLNYTNGAFTITAQGIEGTIGVNGATGAIETVIITDLGTASVSDTFAPQGRAGDGNGQIVIQSLGEVTAVTINAAGSNYSVGDICTVVQGDSDRNCKFAIGAVQSLLPTQVADAVTFKAISAGTILPVAIDYVLVCPADSVALK